MFAEVIGKRFGGDTDAYVDYLYDNSVFANERKARWLRPPPERRFERSRSYC